MALDDACRTGARGAGRGESVVIRRDATRGAGGPSQRQAVQAGMHLLAPATVDRAIDAAAVRLSAVRKTVHFDPSARLQSILSRELVADPNVAVLEFVKNAYDAGATRVLLHFAISGEASERALTIADDGEGMDTKSFERNWMRPGFSEKADAEFVATRQRVPAGEKGLGRLAAGRLGDVLDVYSRHRQRQPWLHGHFDWRAFEDMNQSLSKIGIPLDDETEPDLTVGSTGTVVCISELRLNWNTKVPGRKASGRHPTRLGRLRQDLEMLLMPLTAVDDEFEIWIDHDSTLSEDDPPGRVEPPSLDLLLYKYDFAVIPRGKGWQVRRTIYRGGELLEDTQSRKKLGPTSRASEPLIAPPDSAPIRDVGSFAGSFFYAPDSADQLRRMRAPMGVRLYRDGIRVEPYGRPGNDWLGAQAKKASRQGYAAIQPGALYGAVWISRHANPLLRSQANREGILENDAYLAFLALCRAEFAHFEEIVFEEYVKPKWETPAEERRSSAQARQNYALSLTRAVMHGVNQPVGTANATLDRLQTLISRRVADRELQAELQDLHDKTARQVARIGEAIRRVLEMVDFDPTPVQFDVVALVQKVIETEFKSDAPDVRFDVDVDGELSIDMPPAPLEEAIIELVRNAVEAPRNNGATPTISITSAMKNDAVQIVVTDNGAGIDPHVRDDLFKRAASTKGSIGIGLIVTRNLLHLVGADVGVEDYSGGACFAITLPTPRS